MIYVTLATKLQNDKKKVFMIYVALTTRPQNYKKVFMMYVIHVCLDVALMEGEPASLCEFWKHPPTDTA